VKLSTLEPYYIFIAPPSFDELEKRLRGRATESEEAIQIRLQNAANEMQYGETPGNFDRIFINNNLQECFESMVQQFEEWYPSIRNQSE
jgi:guanylate kinase